MGNWSAAAERALAMAGGLVSPQGLVLGRGKAEFRVCGIGGKKVNKQSRPDMDGPASATEVHLCRSSRVVTSHTLTLNRRLRIVACLLRNIAPDGFTLA